MFFLLDNVDSSHLKLAGFENARCIRWSFVDRPRPLTMTYAAPEVVQHQRWSHSSDMWACGVMLHELLLGVAPFQAEGVALGAAILSQSVDVAAFDQAGISEDAQDLVLQLLHKRSSERPHARFVVRHRWFTLRAHKQRQREDAVRGQRELRAQVVSTVPSGRAEAAQVLLEPEARGVPASGWNTGAETRAGELLLELQDTCLIHRVHFGLCGGMFNPRSITVEPLLDKLRSFGVVVKSELKKDATVFLSLNVDAPAKFLRVSLHGAHGSCGISLRNVTVFGCPVEHHALKAKASDFTYSTCTGHIRRQTIPVRRPSSNKLSEEDEYKEVAVCSGYVFEKNTAVLARSITTAAPVEMVALRFSCALGGPVNLLRKNLPQLAIFVVDDMGTATQLYSSDYDELAHVSTLLEQGWPAATLTFVRDLWIESGQLKISLEFSNTDSYLVLNPVLLVDAFGFPPAPENEVDAAGSSSLLPETKASVGTPAGKSKQHEQEPPLQEKASRTAKQAAKRQLHETQKAVEQELAWQDDDIEYISDQLSILSGSSADDDDAFSVPSPIKMYDQTNGQEIAPLVPPHTASLQPTAPRALPIQFFNKASKGVQLEAASSLQRAGTLTARSDAETAWNQRVLTSRSQASNASGRRVQLDLGVWSNSARSARQSVWSARDSSRLRHGSPRSARSESAKSKEEALAVVSLIAEERARLIHGYRTGRLLEKAHSEDRLPETPQAISARRRVEITVHDRDPRPQDSPRATGRSMHDVTASWWSQLPGLCSAEKSCSSKCCSDREHARTKPDRPRGG
mmetsp:Transcript_34824/g.90941  ORF Transcript_34824/g.90941 Transcript_34824/m.90941 type:complete len:799 (-) Transcript_34824:39-2435(-)